ncbi:MAG TPA: hypothetical protein VF469_40390 [Kofleriaceae bacterium]
MKTTNRLTLALALTFGAIATGCGASDPSAMGDDGGGSGGGGDAQPRALDATGTYTMHSTFDLATNMPGTAGTVVNTIISATDDPDDPTRWIVDQIIAKLPDGALKTALSTGKNFVVGFLNDKLLDIAPDFVGTMVQVGNDFGDIARHFGLNETLDLTRSGDGYTAVHSVVGVHYKLDNQEGDFTFANYQVANVVVQNVGVTMDRTGQMMIAAHKLPLAYGQVLRLGLDAAIIPMIDSSAHNLNDLFAHKIDCTQVGTAVANALDLGFAAGTFKSACIAGLSSGANFVYAKIAAIDGNALQFSLNGTARGVDRNNDRKVDVIQTGTWSGTLAYGTTPTQLLPATFDGARM